MCERKKIRPLRLVFCLFTSLCTFPREKYPQLLALFGQKKIDHQQRLPSYFGLYYSRMNHSYLLQAVVSNHCGCTPSHSDLECPITSVNSKIINVQIFNFFLLQVIVYILYFDELILNHLNEVTSCFQKMVIR